MKKLLLCIIVITTVSFGVNAQNVNFNDSSFKVHLVDNTAINTNGDGEIQVSEASAFTGTINVSNLSLFDLTGIEAFTALTRLRCQNNFLSNLDVSANTALTQLQCANNQLTSLDLSANTALIDLTCSNNSLTSLNVKNGNNTNVTFFIAGNNPNLQCIEVDNAIYSTTNWTNIDSITSFSEDCSICTVFIPDVSFKAYLVGNTAINTNGNLAIECSEASAFTGIINVNNLSITDLTGIEAFTALTQLLCANNSLSNLDVSANTVLTFLDCSNNSLTSLDVSNITALNILGCANNSLTSLDLSANTAFTFLDCPNNSLASLNLKNGNNTNVAFYNSTNNPHLVCIEVDVAAYSTTNWTNIDPIASFSEDCNLCTISIPDTFFKAYLVGNTAINTNADTEIQCNEASAFRGTIDVSNLAINDLTGIEAFTKLNILDCSDNLLTSLDVSANNQLTTLNCANNYLSNLDVSNITALLTTLWCRNNQLTSLDLSAYTAFNNLDCSNNSLTSLNVKNGNNTNVAVFFAGNNPNLLCIEVDNAIYSTTNWTDIDPITSFSEDCSICTVFIPDANFKAYLVGNTAINTNGNIAIECNEASAFTGIIDVDGLSITDLTGIEAFTALTQLECSNNSLSNLDVSNNTALTILRCHINQLTSLDVSANTALTNLRCNNNLITNLDLSANTVLTALSCSDNSLINLNLKNGNNTNVTFFNSINNPSLICIDVDDVAYSTANWTNIDPIASFGCNLCIITIPDANFKAYLVGNTAINTNGDTEIQCYEASAFTGTIDVGNMSITDLTGIEAFTALTELICYINSLSNLDVSNNTALTLLECSNNPLLTSLDVSANTALTFLGCFNNSLTSLDLSANTALTNLRCDNNSLTSLDLSANTALTNLRCDNNSLTSLDLSANTALTALNCDNNSLTSLNVKNGNNTNVVSFGAVNNPSLTCIDVDDVVYSTTNWTNIDPTASFSEDCNLCTITIPDANFIAYLVGNTAINTNGDTEIQCSEANAFTGTIDVDGLSITDLTGIEAFTALTTLTCSNNSLINLDVSANTSLTFLDCSNNSLTRLNVKNGNNTNVTFFNSINNPNLICIDVDNVVYSITNWTNIDPAASFSVDCNLCTITIPDANFKAYLVGNTAINTNADTEIQCSEANAFTGTIDVDGLSITDLTGIEAFTKLTTLNCDNNSLSNLDVSANTALTQLECSNNLLSNLDVSNNTDLTALRCHINQLTILDVSANTALTNLRCNNNLITSLDLSANTVLTALSCSDNSLTSLNVKNGNNTNITFYNSTNNPNLTCINVDDVAYSEANWTDIDPASVLSEDCSNLCIVTIPDANFKAYLLGNTAINTNGDSEIECSEAGAFTGTIFVVNLGITDLTGIEAFTALTELFCFANLLSNLDVSNNTALTRLHCHYNALSNLDVSNNTALTELKCGNNQLTSLDVSVNTALIILQCDNNQLTSLDVSTNTALQLLHCNDNSLSNLDVRNGNNTSLLNFKATNNPNLTCINIDNAAYSTTNWTNIDAQTSFSINCMYPIQLSAKAYLQGAATNPNAGEETWMRDDLRAASLIPTTSPYTDALTVNASVFTLTGNNAIVDWVWVELRDENDNTNILASQSALLQRDGDVVDIDGISPVSFNLSNGNYYVAVSHRNHLGILSANTFALSSTVSVVNLSNSFAVINGGINAVVDLGNGIFACYAGDYDGNDQIQNTDVNSIVSLLGNSGYSNADTDLNGQTQNTDINILINPNIGKGQQYLREQLNLYAKRRTN